MGPASNAQWMRSDIYLCGALDVLVVASDETWLRGALLLLLVVVAVVVVGHGGEVSCSL